MSQENVEIVRRIFERYSRDGTVEFGDYDPEFEMRPMITLLTGASFRGRAGYREFEQEMSDTMLDHRFESDKFLDAGPNHVVVLGTLVGRGKSSGAETRTRQGQVWTFRDGKILRWDVYDREEAALEAVGLSEQDAHSDS